MESLIAGSIILSIVGIIGYAIWVAANGSRPNLKTEEAVWQRLAKTLKLTFTPSGNLPDTYVSGSYRGYFLTLRTIEDEGTGHIETYAALRRERVASEKVRAQALEEFSNLVETSQFAGQLNAEPNGLSVAYREPNVATSIDHLQHIFDLLDQLMALYPQLFNLGGETVVTLHSIAQSYELFQPFCLQLIRDIAQDTDQRLGEQILEFWCPRCLTQFTEFKERLGPTEPVTVYGCRTCRQSREPLQLPKGVVALLDNQAVTEKTQQDGLLQVNWISRRQLFDFDQVMILHATDEEVERFAVQVGNDTDEWRRNRYEQMVCTIGPGCELSTNTTRILQSIFKVVSNG